MTNMVDQLPWWVSSNPDHPAVKRMYAAIAEVAREAASDAASLFEPTAPEPAPEPVEVTPLPEPEPEAPVAEAEPVAPPEAPPAEEPTDGAT